MASDSFPTKLVDDFLYEFEGKHSVRKAGEIVIEGMNPSAEGNSPLPPPTDKGRWRRGPGV